MGISDSALSCWKSFWHCICPCFNKTEKAEKKYPYTRVWEDYFAPHPGEAQWEQLPGCIKETVKRTSDELHKYAADLNHSDDERTALLK